MHANRIKQWKDQFLDGARAFSAMKPRQSQRHPQSMSKHYTPSFVARRVERRRLRSVRPHVNVFQPSFKLREKTRIGARVIKRYHPPVPPIERVLAHLEVAEIDKERLRAC